MTEQHLSLDTAARLYGVQPMTLYRHLHAREQQQQQFRQISLCLPPIEPAQLTKHTQLASEQNDDTTSTLYDEYRPSLRYHPGSIIEDSRGVVTDGYCYQRENICEIVSRDARRELPASFPPTRWLNDFKRVNGLVNTPIPRQDDLFRYYFDCATELNTNRREPMPVLTYYEPSRIGDYNEGTQYCSTSDSECNEECTPCHESQRPVQQLGSNGEPNDSDRELHRQSNTVSPETWERAIEDVVIHGRSLRRTAKAHGVHFATLHRRIKKRSQQKESLPYDPHYIPLEDEAGIVSIIQARANLGVIMSYAEVEDLLLHSALNHRAELSIHDATELVRKFCSRVEASVHHLVKDWPLPAAGKLYSRLEPASPTTPTPPTPPTLVATTIPTETGDIMPLTSSSTSSVSPHPILPPVSALHRISGSGPAISALMLPRGEWSGGMGAMATAAATAEVTPTAATSSGVALASDEIILYL